MPSPRRIAILGGEGSGIMVAEAIRSAAVSGQAVGVFGFLNDNLPAGTTLSGYPVIGAFEQWRECPSDVEFISAIPKAKQALSRYQRLVSLGIPDDRWASIVHPLACVSPDAAIGPGSFVGPGAIVEPGVVSGVHACLRGHCYVSHDVRIGNFVFVGSNATILGRMILEDGVHVGAGSVCHEDVVVGRFAVIGIGAVVIRSVPEYAIVAGNPARPIGRTDAGG